MKAARTATRSGGRRALVLIASLIVIVIGAMVGSTALTLARAERDSSEGAAMRVQSRAAAWSGVQAVMAELLGQRDRLLAGEAPEVTQSWTLWVDEVSGRQSVWRIVPLGEHPSGLVSETGKLNINSADAETLARLPQVSKAMSEALVRARESRRFTSVSDLLGVEGFTPELLFGSGATDSGERDEWGMGDLADRAMDSGEPALEDLLTVFNFDPNVQSGAGDDPEEHLGAQCVNLNVEWNDDLGRAVEDRFGRDVAQGVQGLMRAGVRFQSRADIVQQLRNASAPEEMWPQVLDVFSTSGAPYRSERVDLLTAPAAVLACLPGVGPEVAEVMVSAREGLSEERRRAITWPLAEGLMEAAAFQGACAQLTSRSMQWRVRIEAGWLDGEPGAARAGDPLSIDDIGAGAARLRHRVVLEAVVDVASQRPRVAYLRDVTLLDAATTLASRAGEPEFGRDLRDVDPTAPLDSFDEDPVEFEEPSGRSGSRIAGRQERAAARAEARAERSRRRSDPSGDTLGPDEEPGSSSEGTEDPGDPRIGRWTAGAGGEG